MRADTASLNSFESLVAPTIKVHNRSIGTLCLLAIASIEIDHVTQIRFDQLGGNTLHFVTLNLVTTARLVVVCAS